MSKQSGKSVPGVAKGGASSPAVQKSDDDLFERLKQFMEDKFTVVEDRFESMDNKFVELKVDLDQKFDKVTKEINEVTKEINEVKTMQEELREEVTEQIQKVNDEAREKHRQMRDEVMEAMLTVSGAIDQVAEVAEKEIDGVATKVDKVEEEIIVNQYKSMEFAIRIRGIKECKEENLEIICAEAIGALLQLSDADILPQIDKIYRVNSWVARQRQLPRDVVVYFTTRKLRNLIMQTSYQNKMKIKGEEVLVLKEIPPKMLRMRKEFAFLTKELKNRQLQFRWDVPAGLIVMFEGKRHRLDTVKKARDFYLYGLKVGESASHMLKESSGLAEARSLTPTREDVIRSLTIPEDYSMAMESLEEMNMPKDQRITRQTTKKLREQFEGKIQPMGEVGKSEVVGGARAKVKPTEGLQDPLQKLQGDKNGK